MLSLGCSNCRLKASKTIASRWKYTGRCRKIPRWRVSLERRSHELWSLKCWRRISSDFLTLIRKSSRMGPCTWVETLGWQGSYQIACTAELWTSHRRPSPPACQWPCCPSSPHLLCTTRQCPTPSWPGTSTVQPVPWSGVHLSVWSAAGCTPSSWPYLWMLALHPGTAQHRCQKRAMSSGTGSTCPGLSWEEWGQFWFSRLFSAPTLALGTLTRTQNCSR